MKQANKKGITFDLGTNSARETLIKHENNFIIFPTGMDGIAYGDSIYLGDLYQAVNDVYLAGGCCWVEHDGFLSAMSLEGTVKHMRFIDVTEHLPKSPNTYEIKGVTVDDGGTYFNMCERDVHVKCYKETFDFADATVLILPIDGKLSPEMMNRFVSDPNGLVSKLGERVTLIVGDDPIVDLIEAFARGSNLTNVMACLQDMKKCIDVRVKRKGIKFGGMSTQDTERSYQALNDIADTLASGNTNPSTEFTPLPPLAIVPTVLVFNHEIEQAMRGMGYEVELELYQKQRERENDFTETFRDMSLGGRDHSLGMTYQLPPVPLVVHYIIVPKIMSMVDIYALASLKDARGAYNTSGVQCIYTYCKDAGFEVLN